MMKRYIGLALLTLLMCGCAAEPQATTAPTETAYIAPTEPAGCYLPGSDAESLTDGAVRTYVPEEADSYAIKLVDGDLLLFSGTENTRLTKLSGDNLFPVAAAQLEVLLYPEDPSFQVSGNGITYYDAQTRTLIFLDDDLKEVNRLAVPENITGTPVLSSDRMKLYYCTAEAVRVLDLETGLDKLLKQIAYPDQSVEGILLGDTVLQCSIADTDRYTLFLSTETGELLWEARSDLLVAAGQDTYYAKISGSHMQELVYGVPGEEPRLLIPEDAFADSWYLENENALVTANLEGAVTALDYYDLESGLRTASMEIPGDGYLWCAEADTESGCVYLMGYDPARDRVVIYRWDVTGTPAGDETVYAGPRYTLENPDTEGLAACAGYAQELGERHGVQILVGFEAADTQPWDYEMETEYQVPVIRRELEKLEALLERFPEGFLETMGSPKICLVRSLTGSAESGSLDTANGIQFWVDDSAYVALVPGNVFEKTFYHELFHVIETHVFSECTAYYDWESLNPEGFEYDLDYIANQGRQEEEYLRDETRAFIDTYSMSYPKEDRARLFEYAATAGNEHYFQSETMKAKLTVLCQGIREAFDLREYPLELVWEQYLNEPLYGE